MSDRPIILWGRQADYPLAAAAAAALRREGVALEEASPTPKEAFAPWLLALASMVAEGHAYGAAVFCEDPWLAACLAGKLPGVRPAAVTTAGQAAAAVKSFAANVLLVAMPGRTFYEARQILSALDVSSTPVETVTLIAEVEAHANR